MVPLGRVEEQIWSILELFWITRCYRVVRTWEDPKNLQVERVGFCMGGFGLSLGVAGTGGVILVAMEDLWSQASQPFGCDWMTESPVLGVLAVTGLAVPK